MNRRVRAVVIVAVLATLAGLAIARRGDDAKAVLLETVEQRHVRASVLTSGTLVYERQSLLSPELIGRVREVLVKEGDVVEEGQVLLVLQEDVFRADVDQQRAAVSQQVAAVRRNGLELQTQRRQAARMSELFAARMIDTQRHEQEQQAVALAEVALQSANGALQQARAQMAQSEQRLSKTVIRAPMAGVVVSLSIKPGETAVPSASGIAGSSLLTIADPDSLIIEVNVDEADIGRIRAGQEAALFTAGNPDAAVAANVRDIALTPRQANPLTGKSTSRDYTVRLTLADGGKASPALRPGMSCRAEVYTNTAQTALAVPLQAVFSNNDEDAGGEHGPVAMEHYVFVEQGGRAHRRVVEVGLSDDRFQEIRAGIALGERIVTGPYKQLRHLVPGDALLGTLQGRTP
jgi:HlyD family secretion protein